MKRTYTLLFLLSLTFYFLSPNSYGQNADQKLYRIYVEEMSRIQNLEKSGVNIYNLNPGSYVEIIATQEQAKRLEMEGFQVEYLAENFADLMKYSRLKASSEYHDHQETVDEMADVAARFPEITQLTQIGESVLGRSIMCLKISDNPTEDEDEIPILICGAHHGNEVLSVEATLHQLNYMVDNYGVDDEVTYWIDNYEIWFVPLVNPDGREAVRRYNENGIDLNRNYSFEHTAGGTHGDEGFSEPETRAIRDLAAQYPPVMSLTYHTSGRYVLYSWTHTDLGAPDSTGMIYLGNIIAESIEFPDGNTTGHYTLMQGGRWYFTAGEYCDYMYATYNTLAFTVEMWTRQNPDGSVIPEVEERNLEGLKTMLRQASKAGVTGTITDKETGVPIQAQILVPAIDDQGKVNPIIADGVYGRYYRYFSPGDYQLLITAEGYRDQLIDVTIDSEIMTNIDVQMESGPLITIGDTQLLDSNEGRLSGDGNGRINLGEKLGFLVSFNNINAVESENAYALVTTNNSFLTLESDSLFIGNIPPNDVKQAVDTLFFTVSSDCSDGAELNFILTVCDSKGPGWKLNFTSEMYAPQFEIEDVTIMDTEGDDDGIWDAGETITASIQLNNIGRQSASSLSGTVSTNNAKFDVLTSELTLDILPENTNEILTVDIHMDADVTDILIGQFQLNLVSAEGYSFNGTFQLTNVDGFYDDFEGGENGWTHASYENTSNNHDDWMLGSPVGKAGDPEAAFSGENCWGTDMGWDWYMGEGWNGEYQVNVHNYLMSPKIDCSEMSGVGLKYMQVLTTALNDVGRILVNDSLVWESARRGHSDLSWIEQSFDISGIADGNPDVRLVFELKSNNYTNRGGWNIDDVVVANNIYSSSSVENPSQQDGLVLSAYPNPFKEEVSIQFNTSSSEKIRVLVIDNQGRNVRLLFEGLLLQGDNRITWDGRNDQGYRLPAGLYTCRVIQGTDQVSYPIVFNK